MAQPAQVIVVTEDKLARVSVLIDWLIAHHPDKDPLFRALDCVREAHGIIRRLIPDAEFGSGGYA